MRRYLLDSSALGDAIDHRRGVASRVRQAIRDGHRVGTCPPVLGEFHYGIEMSASRDENRKRFLAGIGQFRIWPFDETAAEEFGRLRAELRRKGRAMQIVDLQLAAIALTLGNCTVVTSDSDLSAVPGLSVENWAV
jgi:tRNA(fMet)-specific endonuclease VapC